MFRWLHFRMCVSALVVGIVVMGFAMVMKHISSNLFTIGIILSSLVIGPQAANFFLALMLPWVDWIVSSTRLYTYSVNIYIYHTV